jgi:hypothetical protein
MMRRLGTYKTAHIPQPRTGLIVTGLQTHSMTESGRGHREEPEWVMAQEPKRLEYEHRLYHENGGKHRR